VARPPVLDPAAQTEGACLRGDRRRFLGALARSLEGREIANWRESMLVKGRETVAASDNDARDESSRQKHPLVRHFGLALCAGDDRSA
jgi:hypothetical protein